MGYTMPDNIEKRQNFALDQSPYRGWDAQGELYMIHRHKDNEWVAFCNGNGNRIKRRTLELLSAALRTTTIAK